MDTGTLQGIGTVLAFAAFLGICWWAYGKDRKKDFDEAARLVLDDEPAAKKTAIGKSDKPAAAANTPNTTGSGEQLK
ncbi:Probable cytochrome c oxidase, subunit CcoQ [gamma proteobacterium HdN1]|nr:Probable cytochrome c oxidase, subunit CcoQ [gamma proteobacterium HdN1]